MYLRRKGIGTAIAAAVIIVILGVSGAALAYTSTHETTTTSIETVTQPAVTSTETATSVQTSISTLTSTATATVTGPTESITTTTTAPPSTITQTSTVTGPTSTVTEIATSTLTSTATSTITTTVTSQGATGSSSTSTSASSTSTCATTTTTVSNATADATLGLEFIQLSQVFSGMTADFGANTTEGPVVITGSYAVVYTPSVSSSTYKVSFDQSYEGFSESGTAWILDNGTTIAFDSAGMNQTGADAVNDLLTFASPFLIVEAYNLLPSSIAPTASLQSTGQSIINYVNLSVTVTNYKASSVPVVYSDCFGDNYSLTTLVLSAGPVPGTSFTLMTYLDIQGTDTVSGTASSYSLYLHVLSVTLA